ncbi:MAG: HEAT repeat domain-containing protein [Isosphaerales bacterium]
MANRLSLEDKLAAIRRVREQPPSSLHTAELRLSLGDRSNLVVAAAAAVVGEHGRGELSADLEAAFVRFLVHPLKDDKLCRAKVAVIQALDKLEHERPEIFRKAACHVQLEPVWGGQEDSAASLRAAALFALARIGGSEDLPLLVDSLTDPEKDVRIAAAQALACFASEAMGLLLRFKVRIGDKEPEVLSECFSGLLTINPRENFPFVSGFLETGDLARCEAAVLALGKSRLPEALGALKSCWTKATSIGLREQILLAIAMLRLPAAIDFLLELVTSEFEKDAIAALFALKIHNYDPRLCERIAEAVQKTSSIGLQARFERDFQTEE